MSKLRRTLTNSTALQAAISLAFVGPVAAQPAANARPQGGQVVAGTANINAGAATTTINQSTNRAAIDWRSFDVGSGQSVVFNQPGASSVTLNRVTGPDPSAIAGRISANGQLVLTNPSGVTFYAGAQVNAQSVIVSAPGITNQNFMAGRMVFDQPANPNARIANAGTITVKEAGLAALVAPSVANSGTITARLGHVVLAGAAAHTLDMYGDGLVSIDITKQVTQAPVGPGGKAVTALVTNSGTIAADGGTIQLSASAADGVVNTLVRAGGRIQANTVGGRAGQIEIAGTGGSVVIEGRVAADGRATGTAGGSVVVAGSDATIVAPTARVTANGRAGGGTVAVGTSLARARGTGPAPAGTSARTVVAAGARISADATASGDGGRVTVLSTDSTTMAGAITARGGPSGGNGGTIELSGETGFRLTGTADTSAPLGTLGTIVLDPRDLTITTATPPVANITPSAGTDPNIGYAQGGTTTDAYVTPEQIQGLTGNIRLQATRDLVVANSITYGGGESSSGSGGNLTLEAGRNLTVNSGVTITVPGFQSESSQVPGVVTLTAAASNIPGYDPAGTLTILGNVSTSSLKLSAGTGGIVLGGALDTTYVSGQNQINSTTISTTGPVTQNAGSSITTGNLTGTAASLSLTATGNQIDAIGGLSPSFTGETASGTSAPFTTTAGGVTIVDSVPLTVGSSSAGTAQTGITVPSGQAISLQVDSLALLSGAAAVPALSAPGGTVTLQPFTAGRGIVLTSGTTKPDSQLALTTAETGLINAPTLQLLGATSDVTFGQVSETSPVDLVAHGNFSQFLLDTGGAVTQNTALVVNSLSNAGAPLNLSNVTLQNAGNSIPAIGSLTVNGVLALSTSGPLSVSGTVTANSSLTLSSSGNMTVLASGYLSGPNGLNLIVDNAGTGSLTVAGTVTSNRGTSFTAGTGGIGLSGSVVPGQTLQITSAGPLAETGGGTIVGGTLYGTAASVSLPSRSNTVGTVSGFTTTSGDFLLVDNATLTVQPPSGQNNGTGIAVPTGHTVSLVADTVQLLQGSSVQGGAAISAPGGTLVLAPYTAGGGVLLTSGTAPSTGLSITFLELSQVRATTLQLGGTPGDPTVPLAGTITIGQANDATIDLGTRSITRLNLEASGAITQNAAVAVTTLAGTASSLALANVGNYITELNGFTTTAGDLALHTSSGLAVTSPVAASGNLTLSTVAAVANRTDNTSLLLSSDVSGATVRFDTTDGNGGALGITQTAGVVTAGTLTGVASALGLTQSNQITNLGDFTTTGNLTVTDGRALAVTGAVTSSSGAVTLNAQGISQTSTSSITTAELDGSSTADVVLDSRLNAVSAMGSFSQSGGNFTLVTSSPELDFGANTGQVTATTGSLTFVADQVGLAGRAASSTSISATAGAITFAPFTASRPIALVDTGVSVSASNALTLSTSFRSYLHSDTLGLGRAGTTGPITLGGANESIDLSAFRALQVQTSGAVTQGIGSVLTVSSLNGSAGSITLPGNNNVAALGLGIGGAGVGLAAVSGGLTFKTVSGLSLYGPVSATTGVTLTTGTTSGLTVAGSLTAPTVNLTVGGAVSESSTSAVISADTLSITAASAALPGTGNRIGTLTTTVPGDFTLTDAVALNISGGSSIGGTLNLTVAGAVTGGAITAGALSGSATSLALTAAGNQIGSLGPFSSTGGFSLVDGAPLTVAGTVSDPTAISLNVSGNLTFAGSVSSTAGTVTLTSSGTITQPGGTVTARTLTGSASSVALGAAGNQVTTLGPFTSTGGFSLVNATALTVGGPVSDPTAIALNVSSNLTLAGSLTGAQVTLNASRAITQPGGTITASSLTGSATSVALTATGNQIGALGAFTSTAGFSLVDAIPLTVNGAVSDPTAISLNVSGNLTVAGSLSSTPGTVTLTSSGAIAEPGGTITAGTLTGNATSVALTGSNQIATLGAFTSTAGFSLVDARSLTIAGAVSDPTAIALNVSGNLALSGSLSSAPGTVTLTSSGAITEPGGTVTARTLTGSATSVALTATGNQISSLGAFTSTAGFSLTDATPLTVAGAVSDPTAIALNVSGNLVLSGSLSSAPGTVTLASSGTITEPGGTVTAGILTGSATSVGLTSAGNRVTTLGAFTTKNGFNLVDAASLTVAGAVSDPAAIALTVSGNLTLAGSLTSGTVTLSSSGAITEPGGTITASSLTGSATSVALGGAGNRITALGPFTSTGGFSLVDAAPLTVAGAVSDPTAIALTVSGNLTVAGSLSSTQGTVTLTSSGTITEPGGTITARALTGSATSVAFTATGNQIASLGPFTSAGGFTLFDATPLTVAGPVSDPTAIVLNVGGNLALAGSLTGGAVTLSSSGAITQSGGAITARILSGNAGSVALGGAGNQVTALGPFTSTSGFSLVDAIPLTVNGAVTDPTGVSLTVGGNLTLANSVSSTQGTVTLAASGTITEPGGTITARTLTGSANSVALTAAGNQIGSLGPFTTTAGFSLVDATSLTVAGALSDPGAISLTVGGDLALAASLTSAAGAVTLNSSGSVTQSGGAITAGTLTGSATGSAILGQAGNSIATLAGFITGGDFTLADARSLVVSAPVDPNTVRMTIKGDLALNSSVTGGTVILDVTGAIVEGQGGSIVADNLTARADSASLNGGNQLGALGASATTTGFSLVNTGALTLNGPVSDGTSISVVAAGPITLAGDVSAPTVSLSATGGGITQTGGNFTAGTLSGSADSVDIGRNGAASIGQIAGLVATGRSPGTLTVVDNAPLRISGTVSGRFVSITSTGSMVLADGTVIRTDGQPAVAQLGSTDAAPGSNLTVRAGPGGGATLTQLGTVTVAPFTGSVATLRLDLPASGGAVALTNLQAGNADLVLNLGSGAATGRLMARNLTVLGAKGQAVLSGTVGGRSGDQAAQTSALLPGIDLRYTLNGCVISLATCSAINGVDVPGVFQPGAAIAAITAISSVIRPDILALDVLDLSVTRDRDDPTLLLPNISDKDY